MERLIDSLGRTISYVRISVTDRCNFRCLYCMPEEGIPFIPHSEILSYEDTLFLCGVLQKMGIKKIRFTGGEPLVRRGFVDFLKIFREELPLMHVALTTNGSLLNPFIDKLSALGLNSLNISLDTVDPARFKEITRCGDLQLVQSGIINFSKSSPTPIKINSVLVRGFNDDEVFQLLEFARINHLLLRFIEFMPLDGGIWDKSCFISSDEILAKIQQHGNWEPEKKDHNMLDGPARYYINRDTGQRLGIIAAVSHHFCDSCNRLRITAIGQLRPCLFSDTMIDLKENIKHKNSNNLKEQIHYGIKIKPKCWKNLQNSERHMSQIGG